MKQKLGILIACVGLNTEIHNIPAPTNLFISYSRPLLATKKLNLQKWKPQNTSEDNKAD